MAEHNTFYKKATYYDIVFDRDVSKEVDFLLGAFHKHAGRKARSALDIACGPAYHAREIARRGLVSAGIDLHPEMTQFAQEKAEAEGLAVSFTAADMRDFRLGALFDVAYIIFDGIDALLTNEDLLKHLRAVAANLAPEGLYIIDLTHPRDCSFWDYGKFNYKGKRNGTSVEIAWATNKPRFDVQTGIAEVEMELRVRENGKRFTIKDMAQERFILPQEIQLLAELSGAFQVIGWYGDFDLKQPFDNSRSSTRMIAVLQKVNREESGSE